MKKVFLIVFLGFLIFYPLISAYAGVVPCGLKEDDPNLPGDQTVACEFCHFFVLFNNVITFLLNNIVFPLAILMIAIGGFMYIFAYFNPTELGGGGNPTLLNQAKKLITSVVIGLVITFAAWIIVNTFFEIIGVATWDGWSLKESWWDIPCNP